MTSSNLGGFPAWAIAFAVALLAITLLHARPIHAQFANIRLAEEGEVQELQLQDGSVLVGQVIDLSEPIRFELSSGGVLEIRRAQIRRLRTLEGDLVGGEIWPDDPSDNRLFFGPTGRTIGENRGYLAVFEAIFPSISVGLHDRVTLGGGTILLGDLGEDRPVWLVPKVKVVSEENLHASVGALAITNVDDGWVGILYGVATVPHGQGAFTAGLGYGWVDDDLADTPAVMVGGEIRLSRGVKLITENYYIPTGRGEHEVLLSAGPRFFGDALSADLGFAMLASGDGGLFPLVNFVYNW